MFNKIYDKMSTILMKDYRKMRILSINTVVMEQASYFIPHHMKDILYHLYKTCINNYRVDNLLNWYRNILSNIRRF